MKYQPFTVHWQQDTHHDMVEEAGYIDRLAPFPALCREMLYLRVAGFKNNSHHAAGVAWSHGMFTWPIVLPPFGDIINFACVGRLEFMLPSYLTDITYRGR